MEYIPIEVRLAILKYCKNDTWDTLREMHECFRIDNDKMIKIRNSKRLPIPPVDTGTWNRIRVCSPVSKFIKNDVPSIPIHQLIQSFLDISTKLNAGYTRATALSSTNAIDNFIQPNIHNKILYDQTKPALPQFKMILHCNKLPYLSMTEQYSEPDVYTTDKEFKNETDFDL
jgi:hypothetical protein